MKITVDTAQKREITSLQTGVLNRFDTDVVFKAIQDGNWVKCWDYLSGFVRMISPVSDIGSTLGIQRSLSDEHAKQFVENFGALAGELFVVLFTDPTVRLPDISFDKLIVHHESIHNLIYLFGLDNTDSYVEALIAGKKTLNSQDQKKLLLLLSINSGLDVVSLIKMTDIKYRARAILAYESYLKIFLPNAYKNKIELLKCRHDTEKLDLDFEEYNAFVTPYFACSYLDVPDRHKIKENINKQFEKLFRKHHREIKQHIASSENIIEPHKLVKKDRKRLLVIMEVFSAGHAMQRSWGYWIDSLRSEFDVYIAVPNDQFDKKIEETIKNYYAFNGVYGYMKLCDELKPDVLVLPSVGMNFFGVMASNIRVAPVQVMALGHPATTMSSQIDFVYGQSCLYDERAFPKDHFLADDSPYQFTPVLDREQCQKVVDSIPPRIKGDKTINVSIVGACQKLASPFLELLKEIEKKSPYKVHFTFHLGTIGIDTLYFQKHIAQQFENFNFYGWQSYLVYLKSIAHADIVLNTFPFGHTNTVIDTLLLGKPCIGLDGIEPSAKTERCVLDMVGLSDLFIASDKQDYKKKFHEFADKIMSGDTEFFDRLKIYDKLYGKEIKPADFGKVMKWVVDHATEIKSSGQKFTDVTHVSSAVSSAAE